MDLRRSSLRVFFYCCWNSVQTYLIKEPSLCITLKIRAKHDIFCLFFIFIQQQQKSKNFKKYDNEYRSNKHDNSIRKKKRNKKFFFSLFTLKNCLWYKIRFYDR